MAAETRPDEVDASELTAELDAFGQLPAMVAALQQLDSSTGQPAVLLQPSTAVADSARSAARVRARQWSPVTYFCP